VHICAYQFSLWLRLMHVYMRVLSVALPQPKTTCEPSLDMMYFYSVNLFTYVLYGHLAIPVSKLPKVDACFEVVEGWMPEIVWKPHIDSVTPTWPRPESMKFDLETNPLASRIFRPPSPGSITYSAWPDPCSDSSYLYDRTAVRSGAGTLQVPWTAVRSDAEIGLPSFWLRISQGMSLGDFLLATCAPQRRKLYGRPCLVGIWNL